MQHRSTGDIHLLVQYTGSDGRVDGEGQATPFIDFIDTMNKAAGVTPDVMDIAVRHGAIQSGKRPRPFKDALSDARLMDWLYATQTINGSGDNQRGKYKSAYQTANFDDAEIATLWNNLNSADDPLLTQALVQIDSYGGCINRNNETTNPTSVYQRSSLLKTQFQVYWAKPENDSHCIQWLQNLYKTYFAAQGGKPYPSFERYQGCYINYPDVDMKYAGSSSATEDPLWLRLYYGTKAESLVAVKNTVDPNNLFRHEMSIPLTMPDGK